MPRQAKVIMFATKNDLLVDNIGRKILACASWMSCLRANAMSVTQVTTGTASRNARSYGMNIAA